jgi:hypothetical protein
MLLELLDIPEKGLAIATGEAVGPSAPLEAPCLAPYLRQIFLTFFIFEVCIQCI